MEPKIIVMIVTLAMPNGNGGVHVKPMPTVEHCVKAANIEASDPFVRHVECSELADGKLLLDFKWQDDVKSKASQHGNIFKTQTKS